MRYNRRTDRTRAGIGGTENRMHERRYLRATARTALHRINPPGTKIAKRVAKVRGLRNAKGLYFHGGELTQAANARALKRIERRLADNAAMVSFPHIIIPQEKASA